MEIVNKLILYVMMAFMVVGALDRIASQFGGAEAVLERLRLGAVGRSISGAGLQFEEGFKSMGALGLAMVGVIAMAPLLAAALGPVVIPLYQAVGASPAMFATTLLANDMGGFFLAKELATTNGVLDAASWLYAGLILGAMAGPTIVFSIPVAIGIIEEQDRHFLALGVMAGIVTIPLGCIAGGAVAMVSGVTVDGRPVVFTWTMLLVNLVPVIIFSALVATGLRLAPGRMIAGFDVFAKVLVSLITIGLAVAVLESTLGVDILPKTDPIFMAAGDEPGKVMRAVEVIGYIACVLLGAYPMVYLLARWFERPLVRMGSLLAINPAAAAGLVATLANNIPMFGMMKNMDERGKVINVAFCVSAAFTFGDHLGFTAANAPDMIFAVIVGKLVGGLTAIGVALLIVPRPAQPAVGP